MYIVKSPIFEEDLESRWIPYEYAIEYSRSALMVLYACTGRDTLCVSLFKACCDYIYSRSNAILSGNNRFPEHGVYILVRDNSPIGKILRNEVHYENYAQVKDMAFRLRTSLRTSIAHTRESFEETNSWIDA